MMPVYTTDVFVSLHHSVVSSRLDELCGKSIYTKSNDIIFFSRRKYIISSDFDGVFIYGPYGHRAWTLQAAISCTSNDEGTRVSVRATLESRFLKRTVGGLLLAFIVFTAISFFVGSFVFLFPPVMATLISIPMGFIATNIEGEAIRRLTIKIINDEEISYH